MDTNASTGRFYPFTTPTSATLPSTASSPDPQYRRDSSGSDSVSDEDGSASQRSHPSGRAPQGYGGPRAPYGSQIGPQFLSNRADSATATVYVDDPPYVPPSSHRPSHPSNFVETGPDVPFNPPMPNFHSGIPSSMTSTTGHPSPFRRNSGDNSPTGSHGSGRSDHSGGQSGSSQGSASSGVVSNGSQPRDPLLHGHDVFPPSQRVVAPPVFNPHHYPAYDEQSLRRVGMEHARIGRDPLHAENAYYRPRTHTYPPMGAPQVPLGMGSPDHMQMAGYPPSPEMQLLPMHTDDAHFDRDMRQDTLIPGQTRIQLPQAVAPQSYDNLGYGNSSQSHLRVGDDAYIPTSDADIRRILGLSPDQELSLNALADPPPGQRPGQSIPTLSQLAILGSEAKRLTLQEIYQALEDRFEWFRDNRDDKSWQNSIRHNLSLYKCFRRIAKPITEPGKGSYWVVDYSRGAGTKRPRKRNKRPTKAQLRAMQAEKEAQGIQEAAEEGDSSPDDEEGFPSPAASAHDIPIDPALQGHGHQVGHGRTRSAARSAARRGNSPYAQGVQPSTQQGRRQAGVPTPFPNIVPPTSRQSSATFGQPSFGQPSLAPTGLTSSMFGQSSMGNRGASGAWPPIMNQQAGQMFLPPPHSRAMSGLSTSAPDMTQGGQVRFNPGRSHTLPDMGAGGSYAQQLPPLLGIDQMRDTSGRFAARGPLPGSSQGGSSQQFVQGSARSGNRRTSSSSNSSRD